MKKNIQLIIFLIAALFVLSACSKVITETSTSQESDNQEETIEEVSTEETTESSSTETSSESIVLKEEDDTTPPVPQGEVIQITASGFSPSTLTVSQGTTVIFITMDEGKYWPASNMHPSHTEYPTEGGCIGSTFDACTSLAQGETFEFTFDEVGEWDYHDHKNPSLTGTIIVE